MLCDIVLQCVDLLRLNLPGGHDAASVHHGVTRRRPEPKRNILLDHQYSERRLLLDLSQRRLDLFENGWRQTLANLIQKKYAGEVEESSADRQHFLLASAQSSGRLRKSLPKNRE